MKLSKRKNAGKETDEDVLENLEKVRKRKAKTAAKASVKKVFEANQSILAT